MDKTQSERENYQQIRRKRMLVFGFVVSVVGIPFGIALHMPILWGLALAGVCVGGVKLLLNHQKERS